jgi:uncharacterized protein (TIGR02118 family)
MFYKVIGILKRPEKMTFAEFKQWWLTVHVPRVLQWPGLKAYHVNFALNEDEPFDGVAEVWFNNRNDAENIFSTPEGKEARQAATAESGKSVIFLAEENVIVPLDEVPTGK